jgi:hypothetical protein
MERAELTVTCFKVLNEGLSNGLIFALVGRCPVFRNGGLVDAMMHTVVND